MRKLLLVLVFLVIYVLHQDIWFWTTARPFVFGFMPVGLFYQACFSVLAALFMWLLVRFAWPGHLEQEVEQVTGGGDADGKEVRR
ncbi:MAG TPA: hypothetical protein VER32_11930 [Pyrinomonadaceae bacterium]|nr:hypothetical protein [Pyrinomonadaceae bacterium]